MSTRGKMKDGIIKRGRKFYVVLREPGPDGKSKVQWSQAFESRSEAEEYRDKRRVALRSNTAVSKNRTTVAEYFDLWLPSHIALRSLAPTTQVAYRAKIAYVKQYLGDRLLQELKPQDVSQFYAHLKTQPSSRKAQGLSPATITYAGRVLRRAMKDAVDIYRLIEVSPAHSVPLPRIERVQRDLWTVDQLRAFLEVIETDKHGALIWLYVATGARRGELLPLRWANTDLDGRTITIVENATFAEGKRHIRRPKNGEGRIVPIDNRTVSVLRAHKARQAKERLEAGDRWLDKDLVFSGGLGWPLPPDTPYKRMVKAMAQAKLPRIRLHDLRHLHATWLLEDGEPLHVVANRLGHRDPMVTASIYAHVTEKQSIRAAETYAARMEPPS